MSDETNSNHEPSRPPDAGCSSAEAEGRLRSLATQRLQSLADTAFDAIEKNTGHNFQHDTVERAFLAFQDITASLGLAWLIDATTGTGMSHLVLCVWMEEAEKINEAAKNGCVDDGWH